MSRRLLLSAIFVALSAVTSDPAYNQIAALGPNKECLNFVAVGDSITNPASPPPFGWPSGIATALGSTGSNQGISGSGWNWGNGGVHFDPTSLINKAAANVDPLRTSLMCANGTQPWLILFAGTNDIGSGDDGATTYASFQSYLNARISAGWLASRVIVVTMLPRTWAMDPVYDTGDLTIPEGRRQAYNSLLISGAASQGYVLARIDLDSNLGCVNCWSNSTWYGADGIHPTTAGEAGLSNEICLVMQPKAVSCPTY